MSQEVAVRPSVKSTYKNLSEAIMSYWYASAASDGTIVRGEQERLIDLLHGSPRLTQWRQIPAVTPTQYRIWSSDESASVTVSPDKIYTTRGARSNGLQDGLVAQTLHEAISLAQAIVQPVQSSDMSEDEQAEFFSPADSNAADLDAVLADSHNLEPVNEDDVELIQDVTAEDALNEDQRKEDGPIPVVTVSQKFIEAISEPQHSAKANQKNAKIDGVICQYCGNLNKQAFRGPCPQCPKAEKPKAAQEELAQSALIGRSAAQRLKSLQGRVLTIMDGAFADKTQREAVKTLINKEFRRELNKITDADNEE